MYSKSGDIICDAFSKLVARRFPYTLTLFDKYDLIYAPVMSMKSVIMVKFIASGVAYRNRYPVYP